MTTTRRADGARPPAWLDIDALHVLDGLQATVAEAVEQAAHVLEAVHDHADHASSLIRRATKVLPADLPEDVHRFVWQWLGLDELEDVYAVIATLATGPGHGTASDETVAALVERYGLEA